MNLSDIFRENANTDVSAHAEAVAIRSQLINYLMTANPVDHYGFKALRFSDGKMMLCLRGADIGLVGDDALLWLRFAKMTGYSPDGHISKFKNSGEQVITINCLDDMFDSEAAAKKIIYSHPVHAVLLHELIHYLDSKRWKDDFHKTGSSREKGDENYYNNPKEFNAYYNNLAEPLMAFLRAAKARDDNPSGLLRFAKATDISRDFRANLTMVLNRTRGLPNPALRQFYAALTPRNRRALLKRLFGLHQQVAAVLDDAQAKVASNPE